MSNPFGTPKGFGTSFGAQTSSSGQTQEGFGETIPFAGDSPFGSGSFGQSTGTGFGNSAPGSGNLTFGQPAGANGIGLGSSGFGSGSSGGGFGSNAANSGFGSSGGFGGTSTRAGLKSGTFGDVKAFGTITENSGFGTTPATTVSAFGGGAFGTGISGPASGAFGTTAGNAFGSGGFGAGSAGLSTSGGFGGTSTGAGSAGLSTSGGFGLGSVGLTTGSTSAGFGSGSTGSTSAGFGSVTAFGKTAGFGAVTQAMSNFGTTLSSTSSGFGTAAEFGKPASGRLLFGGMSTFGASNTQGSGNQQISGTAPGSTSVPQSKPAGFGPTSAFSSQTTAGGTFSTATSNTNEGFGTSISVASVFGKSPTGGGGFGSGTGGAFGGAPSTQGGTFSGASTTAGGLFGASNQTGGSFAQGGALFKSSGQSSQANQQYGASGSGGPALFGKNTRGESAQMFRKPAGTFSSEGTGATTSGTHHSGRPSQGDTSAGSSEEKGVGEIKDLTPPASTFILRGSATNPIQSAAGIEGRPSTHTTSSKKNLFSRSAGTGERKASGAPQTLFGKAIASTKQMTWKRTSDGEEGRKLKRRSIDETVEDTQAKRTTLTRRLSSVEDKERVAIICKNVPPRLNNVKILRQHFSKFGDVARVFPKPERGMAHIHFKTHEAALDAKRRGSLIMQGEKRVEIFWSSYSPSGKLFGRKSSTEDASPSHGPIKRQIQDKAGASRFKWKRDDVQDELASMSGTSDVSEQKVQSLVRPDEVKGQMSQPTERAARHASPVPSTSSAPSAVPTKIDKGSIISLKNSVARNNSDKLQILNLRDKVNRLGSKKQSNLATAKAFVGTCTDMCPEKERYDREEKRRLHSYEVLQGTEGTGNPQVNHTLAVKEYSRSSADQEEPLPYELRTLSTLTLTMNYLLSAIADRGEDGKWGDWFDFLWNRTRGIRKEITQQQFCNTESAELLEKCVRYHVFCAERLCEEDMHSFDAKINDENKTKCLQTLKENYTDLEKKQVFCTNEAEMRCYMVLMNLNEGDILRETQQLRPEIQNTTFIKYALKVYSAINSNNYVRFFRLVRGGTFLCSCILHRYFTQVRKKALQILMKAHRKGVQLPLDELVRTLAFDDQNEAAQFCQFFGLTTVDNCVTLDKSSLIEPEENWCPRRSALIERKLSTTVGEAINGGPMPAFSLPEPEVSFDANGKFIGQIIVKDSDFVDSPRKEATKDTATSHVVPDQALISKDNLATFQPIAPQVKITYTNEDVKEIARSLFWNVIDAMCLEIGQEVKGEVDHLMKISQSMCDSVMSEVVAEFVMSLAKQAETEAVILRQKQQKAEREAMVLRSAVFLTSEILKEVLDQETLNLSTAEMREVHAELKRRQILRCSAEVADAILHVNLQGMIQSVAEEVYQKDVVERLQQLDDIEHCVKVKRAGHFFRIWKAQHAARIKLKRSMLDFPSSNSMMDPSEQIDTLIPNRLVDCVEEEGFYVNQMTKLSVESAILYVKRLEMEDKVLTAHEIYRNLCRQKAWKPLNIGSVAGSLLLKRKNTFVKNPTSNHLFWKLVISLPDPDCVQSDHQGQSLSHLTRWLKAKFQRGTPRSHQHSSVQNELLSLYTVPVTHKSISGSVGICVRLLAGNIAIGDVPGSLTGASGLLFVMPPPLSEDPEWLLWEEEKSRLVELMRRKPISPPLPLVVLCPVPANESVDENFVRRCLNIEELVMDGRLSDLSLCIVKYDEDFLYGVEVDNPEITDKVSDSVRWLIDHCPDPPRLSVQHCRSVVDNALQDHFYSRVLYNLKERKLTGYLHQDPETVISLYNAVIVHLQHVLTSPELSTYSWPVTEFTHSKMHYLPPPYWNTDEHKAVISECLGRLQLPDFIYSSYREEEDDWSAVCRDVWTFVQRVVDGLPASHCVDFTSKIRILLRQTRQDFEDTCDLCTGVSQCSPTYINMPWTDLIMTCVEFKVTTANFTDPNSETGVEELMIVYDNDVLSNFNPPTEWRYLENDQDRQGTVSLEKTFYRAAGKEWTQRKSIGNNKAEASKVHRKGRPNTVEPLPRTMHETNQTIALLSTSIEEEKLQSKKFEKYLESLVGGTDMDETDIADITNVPPLSMSEEKEEVSVMSQNSLWDSVCEPEVSVWRYGRCSLDKTLNQPQISEQFVQLEEDLKSQRRSSDVFELQLQRWIQEGV